MSHAKRNTVAARLHRLTRKGYVRLVLRVQKADVPLVRRVVRSLGDPRREETVRALLRERFGTVEPTGLKDLLAAAPLEGIDLSRESDFGQGLVNDLG